MKIKLITKIKQIITMVKKLKQLTFFEQIMSGIAIFVATSILGGGLLMWRSMAVQARDVESLKARTEKLENNSLTLREYVVLREDITRQFDEIKALMKSDRELWDMTNRKINKHIGVE